MCAVVDYDAVRAKAHTLRESKVEEVKQLVAKLQKAQHAAEDALDLYRSDYDHMICMSREDYYIDRYRKKCK